MAFFVAGRTAVNMGTPPFVATATAKKQQMMGLQTSSSEKRSLYRHSRISGFSAVRPARSGSFSDFSSSGSSLSSSSGAAVHHVIAGISSAAATAVGVATASAASASQAESSAAQDPLSVEALRASRRFDLLASSSDSFSSRSDGSMSPISRSRRFDWLVEAASVDGSDEELDLDHHDGSQELMSGEPEGSSGSAVFDVQNRRDDAGVPTGASNAAALADSGNDTEDMVAGTARDSEIGECTDPSLEEVLPSVPRQAKATSPNEASSTVVPGEHVASSEGSGTRQAGVDQSSSRGGNASTKASESSQFASTKPRSSSDGGKNAFEYGSGRFFSAGDYEDRPRSPGGSDEAAKSNDDDDEDDWKPVLGRREAAAEKKKEAAAAKRRQQEAAAAVRSQAKASATPTPPRASAPAAKLESQEVQELAAAALASQLKGDDRVSDEGEDDDGDEVSAESAATSANAAAAVGREQCGEVNDENGTRSSSGTLKTSTRPVALSVAKKDAAAASSAVEPNGATAAAASESAGTTEPTRPALRNLPQPTTSGAGSNEGPRTAKASAKVSSKASSRGQAGAGSGAAAAGGSEKGTQRQGRHGDAAAHYSSSSGAGFTNGNGYNELSHYPSDLDAFAAAQQQQQQHVANVAAALTTDITDFVAWVDAQRAAQASARKENMTRVRAAAVAALGCSDSHSGDGHASNVNALDEASHEFEEKVDTSAATAGLHPSRRDSSSNNEAAAANETAEDDDDFALVEYGSTALGLSLPDSDLDLVLVLSPHAAHQLANQTSAVTTASSSSSSTPPELHAGASSNKSSSADGTPSDAANRQAAVAAAETATPPETTPEPPPALMKAPTSSTPGTPERAPFTPAANLDLDEDPTAWPAEVRRAVQLACLDRVAEQLATQDWVTNLSVVRTAGVPVVRFLGMGGLRLDLSADLRTLHADQNDLNVNVYSAMDSVPNESKKNDAPLLGASSQQQVTVPGAHRRLGHQGLRTKAYVAGRLGLADANTSSHSHSDGAGLSRRRRSPSGTRRRRRPPSRGHPSLRALTLVVKQLLADHGLSDKASGGLSGYGCFLVVDCFLVWHARTMRQLQRGEQPGWLGDDVASDSDDDFHDDGNGQSDGEQEACSLGWLLLAFLEQHATLVDCRRLAFTPRGYVRRTDGDTEELPPAMVVADPAAAAAGGHKQSAGNVARGLYRLSHLEGVLGLAWQCLGRGDGLAAVLTSRPVPQCRHLQ